MRILVPGGAGYIGSHNCKQLAKLGHTPVVIDNLSQGHEGSVKWGAFYKVDLFETEKIIEILKKEKIEAVMHFAAFASVGESQKEPQKYYQNNVMGTLSLLNAMKSADVKKIIFSSTCAVYGTPEKIPIVETTKQNPINPYGRSKSMCESILQDFARAHGFSVVALRYFNACGADSDGEIGEDHDPETHLIPLVLKAIYDPNFTLTVFGNDYPTKDGTCIRDYIHVTDLADAHISALNEMKPGFTAYNLGTGAGFSVKEIISAAEKITGKKVKVKLGERREGDPPALVSATGKWKTKYSSLETIISSANSWYLKN